MKETLEKIFLIIEACKERGLSAYSDIDELEEDDVIGVDVVGIRYAKWFTFYWKKNEEVIHYSSIYELKDKVKINHKIYDQLEYPFNKLSVNENKTALEIEGYIKEDGFNKETVSQILDYLIKGHNIIEEISKISKN